MSRKSGDRHNEEPELSQSEQRARTVERHVASRLRTRRERLGLSVQDLARRVGMPEAEIVKYENLRRRLSAGRLLLFAEALNCPPDYFFEDLNRSERN